MTTYRVAPGGVPLHSVVSRPSEHAEYSQTSGLLEASLPLSPSVCSSPSCTRKPLSGAGTTTRSGGGVSHPRPQLRVRPEAAHGAATWWPPTTHGWWGGAGCTCHDSFRLWSEPLMSTIAITRSPSKLLAYLLTYLLAHSLAHSLTYSSAYSPHSPALLVCLLAYPFTYLPTHLPTYLLA